MNKILKISLCVLLIITGFILAASLYFQYGEGLQPCPLCIMQRICVFFLFISGAMLLWTRQHRWLKRLLVLQIFFAASGIFFAGRQVWLQSLPADQIPACLPGLDALLHYFPWQDILHALFWGSGDCAEINWQWLGLSMPVWSLLYFLAVFCAFIFLFLLVNKQNLFAKASSS